MHHSREGLLSVHAAVLIFSFTALFSKLVSLPALEITFYRSVFACLAIAVYMAYTKQSYRLGSRRDYLMAGLLGSLLAIHWVTYFHAMQVSTVAVGVIALYTYPVITVFLEPLFHGERPHVADIISSIAVLFGIYLIVPEFSLDNSTLVGVLFGVFSALMMSLRNIMQRRYFSAYKASHSLFYQTLVVMLVLVAFIDTDVSSYRRITMVVTAVTGYRLHRAAAYPVRQWPVASQGEDGEPDRLRAGCVCRCFCGDHPR